MAAMEDESHVASPGAPGGAGMWTGRTEAVAPQGFGVFDLGIHTEEQHRTGSLVLLIWIGPDREYYRLPLRGHPLVFFIALVFPADPMECCNRSNTLFYKLDKSSVYPIILFVTWLMDHDAMHYF